MITWQSVIEILLFSTGIFFLYRTLIGLGTWKIVYGILVAMLFFIVSSHLGLKGIEWVYQNVSQVAVLSLVILFQPELRKIFEKTASLRRQKQKDFDTGVAGIIAESLWHLAQNGIGAILVIPGQESVEQWIKGGYPLNGNPSKPLILSIFDPNSPGHDGALIFQDGVFTHFGVRLPVSQSGRLTEEYGTRHQSAMGLCEKTDAFIVVVSEERKQVSVFQNGKRLPMNRQSDIADAMVFFCRDTGFFERLKPNNKNKKHFWIEICASLTIAAALWFTIVSDQGEQLEKVVTVPVEYTATMEDVVMTGEKVREVQLHLAGAKSDLDAMPPGAVSVKIDLGKAVAGQQNVLISKENIRLPRGVKLLDVIPSNVKINLAGLTKVELPVSPQLVGTLPPRLKISAIHIKPDRIQVFIPSGQSGESFKNVTTTPVYLESIQESTTLFGKVVSSPAIQPVEKRWPDVEIRIVVQPAAAP